MKRASFLAVRLRRCKRDALRRDDSEIGCQSAAELGKPSKKGHLMQSIVVTGVSTGIGWGCVKVLIAGGFRVFGSVRKQADAERLTKEFGANFTPLMFDVTDERRSRQGRSKSKQRSRERHCPGLSTMRASPYPDPCSTSRSRTSSGRSRSTWPARSSSRRRSRRCWAPTAHGKARPAAS